MYALRLMLPAHIPDETLHQLAAVLEDRALSYGARRQGNDHQGPWLLEWLFEDSPPAANDVLPLLLVQAELGGITHDFKQEDFSSETLPDVNWMEKVYEAFQPFTVGPFYIRGSHHEGATPDEQIGLTIDAVTAFG
ncbi:MAG TPA: 50S ribosomal protein L11 methyltransferase, partial [Alphaproteobacteria bacterium]|nr:50S ribosomal protein L11 methyltransferase [Alphaproteobacteria bacterium]